MFQREIFILTLVGYFLFSNTLARAEMRIFCSDVCQNTCFNFQSIRSDSKDRCECGPQFCSTEILCKKYRGMDYVFNANAKNRAERCLPKIIETTKPFPSIAPKVEVPPLMKEDEACSERAFQYATHRKACIEGDPGRCLFSNSPEGVALAIVMSAEGLSRQLKDRIMNNPKVKVENEKAFQDLQNRKLAWEHTADRKASSRMFKIPRLMEMISLNVALNNERYNPLDPLVDEASKKILRTEFPKEMAEIEKAFNDYKDAVQEELKGKIKQADAGEALEKYLEKMDEIKHKSPRHGTALSLSTRSNYFSKDNIELNKKIVASAKLGQERRIRTQKRIEKSYEKLFQIEMQNLKAIQDIAFRKATLSAKMGKGGGGVAAMIGAATMAFAPGVIRRTEIESCQKVFDLTESDLKYLKGNFQPDPKADMIPRSEMTNFGSCDDLALSNPMATYYELKKQYGFVPSGICRVMQRHAMRLEEKLTIPSEVQFQSIKDCGETAKAPFTVEITTPQGVRKITAPYIESGKSEVGLYPLFQAAKVYNEKGEYLPLQTQEVVDTYQRLHNPRTKRPDAIDFSFLSDIEGIPQIQVMSNLIRASHRNRDSFNRECLGSVDPISNPWRSGSVNGVSTGQ